VTEPASSCTNPDGAAYPSRRVNDSDKLNVTAAVPVLCQVTVCLFDEPWLGQARYVETLPVAVTGWVVARATSTRPVPTAFGSAPEISTAVLISAALS